MASTYLFSSYENTLYEGVMYDSMIEGYTFMHWPMHVCIGKIDHTFLSMEVKNCAFCFICISRASGMRTRNSYALRFFKHVTTL